jgi:hypothetical protein
MNTTSLKTLAAGLLTCFSLSGLAETTNAQLFGNDTINRAPVGRIPASSQPGIYDSRIPQQWHDQRRMNQRYIPTNAVDGTQDDYRRYKGRCADGQCNLGPENGTMGNDTASYRGRRRSGRNYDSAARYQSRSARTTGWDPGNPTIDPATGLPTERTRRHDHADGEHRQGHCRGGDCRKGQCGCPEGQCVCPMGQRHNHRDGQFQGNGIATRNAPGAFRRDNVKPRSSGSRSSAGTIH